MAIVALGLAVLWAGAGPRAFAEAAPGDTAEKPAAKGEKPLGRLLKIALPITGQTSESAVRQIRAAVDKARAAHRPAVVVLEFVVPRHQEMFAATTRFGPAYDLAKFLCSPELTGVHTVAYVPQILQGHAVLAAIACQELMLGPDAQIGSAGIQETTIDEPTRAAYREIAEQRQTIAPTLAQGLLRATEDIYYVQTDAQDVFVRASDLPDLARRRTIREKRVVVPAGQAGQFTASDARTLGFVKALPATTQQLATLLDLTPEEMEEDPAQGDAWRAVRVDLRGPIRGDLVEQVQHIIDEEIAGRSNFVCLYLDSPGGSPSDSIRLANYLADLDRRHVRTVAYVPREARCDAALIALACDQVVMHPAAVLGGSGAYSFSPDEIRLTVQTISQSLAPKKLRSWSLPAAIVDPNLDVYRYTRNGQTEYFSDEEWRTQPNREQWLRGELVTTHGTPFQALGREAVAYHLANHVVDTEQELLQYYGLDEMTAREPTWVDSMVKALAAPPVSVTLLIIGLVALYIELQAPGIGLGAFIATVCFVLFFWSHFSGGTAGWLEVLLFLAGIGFLALEVFVLPGFGIFGLGGGLLILVSLILASQTVKIPRNAYQFAELQHSMLTVAGALVGSIVVIALLQRWLPRSPLLNQVLLEPPSPDEQQTISQREALLNVDDLVGAYGVTTTPLLPGGKARFNNRLVNVMSEGDEVPPGTEVVVVEVRGSRVVVRPARPE